MTTIKKVNNNNVNEMLNYILTHLQIQSLIHSNIYMQIYIYIYSSYSYLIVNIKTKTEKKHLFKFDFTIKKRKHATNYYIQKQKQQQQNRILAYIIQFKYYTNRHNKIPHTI